MFLYFIILFSLLPLAVRQDDEREEDNGKGSGRQWDDSEHLSRPETRSVLLVISVIGGSHFLLMEKVAAILAKRGHRVTLFAQLGTPHIPELNYSKERAPYRLITWTAGDTYLKTFQDWFQRNLLEFLHERANPSGPLSFLSHVAWQCDRILSNSSLLSLLFSHPPHQPRLAIGDAYTPCPALLAARLALPYIAIFPTSPAARPWKRHQQPYYESKSLWSMFQWKRLRRIWGWLSGEKYDEDPGKQLDETEVEREVWRRFAWVVQKHFVNDEEETNGKKDNHRVPVETDLIWTNSEEMGSVKTSGCDNNDPDVSQQWKKGEMSVVDRTEMRKWIKKQESVSKDSGKNKWFQKRLKGWMECKEEMWNEAQVIIGGEEEYNVSDGKQNEIAFCPIFPPFRNDKMGQSNSRTCCEDNRGSEKRAKEADVREKLMSGRKMQCDEMVERGQCESLSAGLSLPHEWVAEGRRSRTLPRPFTRPRTLAQLEARALVWLYNASPVLEGDSLLLFNEVLLGAMLAKPAKPPPKPLARWLDNAGPEGCVLVALGSMLPSIPRPALTTALAKALGQLGRPVAWRYYAAEWPTGLAIPDNVRLMDWIPLNDALGHPNVRLLVSHGGMNSLLEALYHGVPVLALPLFGDQPENIGRAEALGLGQSISLSKVMEGRLLDAMLAVLENQTYHRAARLASTQLQHPPVSARQLLIGWVEHALALTQVG